MTSRSRSILTVVPGGVLLSVAACGPSDADFAEFDTFHSPDHKHRIIVEMAPSNGLAFSPEAIRLYLIGQNTSERYLLGTTSLANDGSRVTDANITAEWVDSKTVRFCLSGSEQDDEVIVIDVTATSFSAESAECVD